MERRKKKLIKKNIDPRMLRELKGLDPLRSLGDYLMGNQGEKETSRDTVDTFVPLWLSDEYV